ncbi:DUF1990 family protein [Arthrobacter glacialis]|uniref:DUF1990 domain-containing protein n=1 Tax=Arthrobacter glacialis TaxID=1664 RepID=A0A2S3ZW42_ARTGL|nr:DUF1990 domain-containing protein [Arthrobacter glacialis]POH58599.1 DUF1990 domain-containing protein [Arthrobacter glacialis]POH73403.1 DUF1990 domain-containing protein [Arthrobacter glacialis]
MTSPDLGVWPHGDAQYRRSEVTAVVGNGDGVWERAATEVLRWKVKTASGFSVDSTESVAPGQRVIVTARMFGITVHEPVEVVAVVEQPDRVGFAYKTLPGHPVSGEEAFIIHRKGDQVHLSIRSLTRAAPQQPWRALFPILLLAQLVVRRRYLRALL